MESIALKSFRRKMANPLHWRKANRIFLQYTKSDLSSMERTKHLISELATSLEVPLTNQELTQAAKWLVDRDIDPQSKRDRMSLWKSAK